MREEVKKTAVIETEAEIKAKEEGKDTWYQEWKCKAQLRSAGTWLPFKLWIL